MKDRKKYLLTEYATRNKVDVYSSLYKALPDPDKILEENNYDYEIYRNLLTDPHLMATIQQRKMQVNIRKADLNFSGENRLFWPNSGRKPHVIDKFDKLFEEPSVAEGFVNVEVYTDDSTDDIVNKIIDEQVKYKLTHS